jgi:hypothetical protein
VGGNSETLQKKHMIRAFVLASHKCLETTPNPTPPPSTHLHHVGALVHVGEYVWIICALALNTLATPFDKIIGVFHFFHPFA